MYCIGCYVNVAARNENAKKEPTKIIGTKQIFSKALGELGEGDVHFGHPWPDTSSRVLFSSLLGSSIDSPGFDGTDVSFPLFLV